MDDPAVLGEYLSGSYSRIWALKFSGNHECIRCHRNTYREDSPKATVFVRKTVDSFFNTKQELCTPDNYFKPKWCLKI